MLEIMVHLDLPIEFLPKDYVLMTVTIPDSTVTERIDHDAPPKAPALFGSQWAKSMRTPLLWVPSVIVPQSYNIILNCNHPDAAFIETKSVEPLKIDPRLTEFSPLTLGL